MTGTWFTDPFCFVLVIMFHKKNYFSFLKLSCEEDFFFLPDVTFAELQALPTRVTVLQLPSMASFMSRRAGQFQRKDGMPGAHGGFCAEL